MKNIYIENLKYDSSTRLKGHDSDKSQVTENFIKNKTGFGTRISSL